MGLLGDKQARMETGDESAHEGRRGARQAGARARGEVGRSVLRQFKARIDLAKTPDELKAIGKEITPQLRRRCCRPTSPTLREKYQTASRGDETFTVLDAIVKVKEQTTPELVGMYSETLPEAMRNDERFTKAVAERLAHFKKEPATA
jgi:hypothetical protein